MGNLASCVEGTRSERVVMTSCAKDTVINIGTVSDNQPITYNVSQFLRDYSKLSAEWQGKLEKFFVQLDDKTKMSLDDPKYSVVFSALHGLIEEICEKLTKRSGIFDKVTQKRTGSLYAGLRVGLPVEADILLKMKSRNEMRKCTGAAQTQRELLETFHQDIRSIIKDTSHKDKNWIFRGEKKHRVGVCLYLEYREKSQKAGTAVLLDLIPVTPPSKKSLKTTYTYSHNAECYIRSRHSKDLIEKYQLLSAGDTIMQDTAYVQHHLLKKLPENVKSAVRVAKYLVQCQLVSSELCVDTRVSCMDSLMLLNKNDSIRLYGYAPMIRSHVLQVLLLQVLIGTQGTLEQEQLTGLALTLCLMDMIYTVCNNIGDYSSLLINDPVFENRQEPLKIFNSKREEVVPGLQNLTCSLLHHVKKGDEALDLYPLINSPTTCFPKPEVGFTGFCRGSSLDDFANEHNCMTHGCSGNKATGSTHRRAIAEEPKPEVRQSDSWTTDNFDQFRPHKDSVGGRLIPGNKDVHSYVNVKNGRDVVSPSDVDIPVTKDGYFHMK